MRTVDSALTAVLASGNYIPYAHIHCLVDAAVYEHHDPIYYELTGTACKVMYPKQTYISPISFTIERGCIIAGVEVGLTSGTFYPTSAIDDNGIITMEGIIFKPVLHITVAGNDTYQNVLTAIATEYEKTAAFANGGDAYWSYEFLPTGKFVDINRPEHFISLIRQKYLLFAVDNGGEEVKFFYPAITLSSGSVDWDIESDLYQLNGLRTRRNMMARDENYDPIYAYTVGAFSLYPRHNLGYIKSTESMPRSSYPAGSYVRQDLQSFEFTCRPDLRYQDGDSIYIASQSILSRILVKEIWHHKHSPSWKMVITGLQYFHGTEAGNMPAEFIAIMPYAPLDTGSFNGVLDETDTFVQHAFETLDDHSHNSTTPCRYYLSADIANIPASTGARIDLDTELYDLGNNWLLDNWYGAAGAYTQADAAGCNATTIVKTGAGFHAGMIGSLVRWASDAAGTLNLGTGYVTAVPGTTTLTIIKATGVNFANSYYFWIKKSFYLVPSTGVYLITLNARFDPTEDQRRYAVSAYNCVSSSVSLGADAGHASGTSSLVSTCSMMVYLTAGDLIGILVSAFSLAGTLTVKGGATGIYASYTSLAITRIS